MSSPAADLIARARAAFDERGFGRAVELCEVGLNRGPSPEAEVALRALRDEATRSLYPIPEHAAPPPPIFWRGTEAFGRGAFTEAAALFRKALAETPASAQVRAHLGMALVGAGEFVEGFAYLEARRHLGWAGARTMAAPLWGGEPIHSKTLVLWDEQGHGDAIQFVRFAGLAAARSGARIVFHGRPRLCRLFRNCPGIAESLPRPGPVPRPDAHASLMSLPALLRCGPRELGESIPCFFPEPALSGTWDRELGPRVRPRIGFFWQGNPGFHDDRRRSFPLATYHPLLRRFHSAASFFSLQKWAGEDQLAHLPPDISLPNLGAFLDRSDDGFVETVAVLSKLDLLITSDSAIAHLAGGLGMRVWVLLGVGADWRWGEAAETTPFYPTMRLYRRRGDEPWSEVAARVENALEILLVEGRLS